MLPTIATGNVGSALAGEYEVANSLRFDSGSSPKLVKSQTTATNRKKWTWSCWFKLGNATSDAHFFAVGNPSGNHSVFYIDTSGILRLYEDPNQEAIYYATQNLRDKSAWYNLILVYDSTESTSSDRLCLYINGVKVTSFSSTTYPSLNRDSNMGESGQDFRIGTNLAGSGGYFDGYMTEVVFCDGQALDQTSFGEFDEDSGIWKPIDVSGLTFGNNGFYLDFEDSSNLGNDANGGTDFTETNITSIDQTTDTCTNNFATLNPLNVPTSNAPTFSEGNLKGTSNSSGKFIGSSTIGVSSGKWYMEVKVTEQSGTNSYVGVADEGGTTGNARNNTNGNGNGILYKTNGQYRKSINGTTTNHDYGDSYATGDIIGIALNCDDNEIYFYKNGTIQNSGTAISIPTPDGFLFLNIALGSATTESFEANFGNPSFSISSGNSDGNGYGNFEYSVPSGYYALNTKNLAEYG